MWGCGSTREAEYVQLQCSGTNISIQLNKQSGETNQSLGYITDYVF